MHRPIDKKENYVKRCIGLPGDTLEIINRQVFIDGEAIENPENLQYNYRVLFSAPNKSRKSKKAKKDLNLTNQDINKHDKTIWSLTNSEYELLKNSGLTSTLEIMSKDDQKGSLQVYPNAYTDEFNEWTFDDLGPIYIPKSGETIELNERNLNMYRRVISVYDGNELIDKDSVVYINGKVATEYTFKQDYYWMMGDNRHNSADSRQWGFVPTDHIVGRASFIWFSRQTEAQHGESKIRTDRIFTTVK